MALTGMIDFRKSWFGGLTLHVEEEVKARFSQKTKRRWRRATFMDLAQPELRILIDMRSRPYLSASISLRSAAGNLVNGRGPAPAVAAPRPTEDDRATAH